MPTPKTITEMGNAAHYCGVFRRQFANPQAGAGPSRAQLERPFHVYLELAMQSKHDENLRAHCASIGLSGRRRQGNQVNSGPNATSALANFYVQRASMAAQVASQQMITKWGNNGSFTLGVRVDAMQQGNLQIDGFRYELSYWYDPNGTYVLFHCY